MFWKLCMMHEIDTFCIDEIRPGSKNSTALTHSLKTMALYFARQQICWDNSLIEIYIKSLKILVVFETLTTPNNALVIKNFTVKTIDQLIHFQIFLFLPALFVREQALVLCFRFMSIKWLAASVA